MKGSRIGKIANLAIGHLKKSIQNGDIASVNYLGRQVTSSFHTSHAFRQSKTQDIPDKCDVCIIGGGAMGASTAFWLKRHAQGKNLKVVVIERDNKYTKASTVLSMGGIRQQFSNGENVQLSLFGAEFIRNIQDYLGVEGDCPVDLQYHPGGYLFIACSQSGAEILHENHLVQKQFNSKVELITKEGVKKRYPKLSVDDIVLASIGLDNEGWFDPWSLLNGLKKKAISLGAQYLTGEVVGFNCENDKRMSGGGGGGGGSLTGPKQLYIRDDNGQVKSLEFSECVIAAGYDSGAVGKMAGIGTGTGVLEVPIPVEPKKRYVYYLNAPELVNDRNLPLTIEPNGVWFRPDSPPGSFFCGRSPDEDCEPSCENLDVDYSFFDTDIWPTIANRVKAFENIKIKTAYGGYYDYNTFDQNGIIGTHPVFKNFHIVTGFSGHGIQQAPAAGHAIMELILEGGFKAIDLTRFGFERVVRQERVLERNIV